MFSTDFLSPDHDLFLILSCCLDGFDFPSQETKDKAVAIEKKFWNKDSNDSSPHISPIKRKQPSAKHNTPKPKKKRAKASPADLEKERKKAAQEEKRKAKQAQIAAGKELANKLFLTRTPHSGSETSESEDEDPLHKAKKELEALKAQLKEEKVRKICVWLGKKSFKLLLALSLLRDT